VSAKSIPILQCECTQFAIVWPLVGRTGRWRGIGRARRLQCTTTAELAVLALRAPIAALVLLLLHVPIPAVFGGRGQRVVRIAAGLQAHVLHARRCPLHVQVPELRLEVLNVAAAVLDLAVETREHGRVVGRLAHGIGGVDQGLLAVDLALHIGNRLVDARHGCRLLGGSARRRA
jgi:hypothetical protein